MAYGPSINMDNNDLWSIEKRGYIMAYGPSINSLISDLGSIGLATIAHRLDIGVSKSYKIFGKYFMGYRCVPPRKNAPYKRQPPYIWVATCHRLVDSCHVGEMYKVTHGVIRYGVNII